jgi:beta-glucosidase/6-phospho-beta-glucosidase/beta-galactosidase
MAFPVGFLWGAGTSAHQVEGGNCENDWWSWEIDPNSTSGGRSGDACEHWSRYPADLDLLAGLGLNSYRFSVEWSRVEAADGAFSAAALEHYRQVCEAARTRGLEPVVVFHHFTTPKWVADAGGWLEESTVDRFVRFCEKVAAHLDGLFSYACTINEPNVLAAFGYELGLFPPGTRITQTGFEYRPEALGVTVRRAAEMSGLPVLVTENGICTLDDAERIEYTATALRCLEQCIDDGVNVLGYLHWSALDSFEWILGFWPKYGLIEVDLDTQERRPRPSASWLGRVAKANRLLPVPPA